MRCIRPRFWRLLALYAPMLVLVPAASSCEQGMLKLLPQEEQRSTGNDEADGIGPASTEAGPSIQPESTSAAGAPSSVEAPGQGVPAAGSARGGNGFDSGSSGQGVPVECPFDVSLCRDCGTALSCADPAPYCADWLSRCSECTSAEDCGAGQTCDPALQRCTPACSQNLPCPGDRPWCERSGGSGYCVECSTDADCSAGGLAAPDAERNSVCYWNTCVECYLDWHCLDRVGRGFCDSRAFKCVECVRDRDCSFGQACRDGECNKISCNDNGDCQAFSGYCEESSSTCVQCLNDDNCGPNGRCNNNRCEGCRDKADCPPYQTCLEGSCVECADDGDCSDPRGLCDTEKNACVECLSQDDCAAGRCSNGNCVECLEDNDCSDEKPICNIFLDSCVQCLRDDDCPMDSPICNQPYGLCGQCLYNNDCPDQEAPFCDISTLTCVACRYDLDCTGASEHCEAGACVCSGGDCNAPEPCDPDAGPCPVCQGDGDCDPGLVCSAEGSCVQCTLDDHCSEPTPFCDTDLNACVECRGDQDCGAGYCSMGTCLTPGSP